MFTSTLENFLKFNSPKKIVFTNGCFDILHRGHVAYLNEAKKLGDILIIGLNSDASVRMQNKGDDRPINNENDRKYLLENLKSVDFVEIFHEPTPFSLIQKIRPQVLVKGGDWKIEQIVGGKEVISWGGDVFSLSFIDGYSTTKTLSKIRNT